MFSSLMFYRCISVYANVTVVFHQEGLSIFFAYIVYYLYTIDITFFYYRGFICTKQCEIHEKADSFTTLSTCVILS